MKLVVDIAVATGTLLVAVAAIWGPLLRSFLAPPKLTIEPHNLRGTPTRFGPAGERVMYYHLKVVNLRPWLSVPNCKVLLTAISRKGPDHRFHPVTMPVPFQFIWAPQEETQRLITITKEHVFDFGRLFENGTRFEPLLYISSLDFQGFVEKGESLRYHLEIYAADFTSPRPQIFEVAWDGRWSVEPEKMKDYLVLTEIK